MAQDQSRLIEPRPVGKTKAGWRVEEWADDCGLSRSYAYNLLARGVIDGVRIGRNRIITTPPSAFLARFQDGEVA